MTSLELISEITIHIDNDTTYTDVDQLFERLSGLVNAHAPANGCHLPGAIGDVIRSTANEFGLKLSTNPQILATGNLAIEIGANKREIDLVITAHMDRPSFRVLSEAEGTLYPICAIRIDGDEYVTSAKAVHFENEEISTTANGKIIIRKDGDDHQINFQTESGYLNWSDTVLMDTIPQRQDDKMIATGLDNSSGTLLALLSARVLHSFSALLEQWNQKILIVFTDQEEGPPTGLFGQGAARLSHAIPPPRLGFINMDAHNVDATAGMIPGVGVSHAFVSGLGRGSVIPLDYQALAQSIARIVNEQRPNTVKLNYGYVSRSDDMLLSLWSRCLGLIGVPLANAHTTEETISLKDMVDAVYWIPTFIMTLLDTHSDN